MVLRPRNTSQFFRISSAVFGAAVLLFLAAEDAFGQWKIQKVNGRDYVTDENVNSFYKFERFARDGNDRLFRHPSLIMRWKVGSQAIYINNIKFNLSFPIAEKGGKAMISTIDLAKLVDPVLRPSYIRKPIIFDTVVIDAGHGAHDSGAKGVKGYEKDYALDLSIRLEAELKKLGFKTEMTRRTDKFLTLSQRVAFANKQKNAIFVSIHFNSSGNTSASGIETYSLAPQGTASTNGGNASSTLLTGHRRDAENIALATSVHAHVIHELKTIDRGIKRARFNVLRGINKPAILFEGGFITNPTEGTKIDDAAYRQQLAASMASAIIKFQTAVGKKK
ncbi:MAG: N-acetylmuramoyl-L-alanine amidase [Verrucomicrobiales bacterium]|nr:N-acetylmuramoyl-L-alanine amidase [Verrucomicrobiales bacterium]